MRSVTLGSTGITTVQNAFGALPIQRVSEQEAVRLLRKALDGGMRYFDTARAYSIDCRQCAGRCPYELSIPELLRENWEDYKAVLAGKVQV